MRCDARELSASLAVRFHIDEAVVGTNQLIAQRLPATLFSPLVPLSLSQRPLMFTQYCHS